MVAFTAEWAEGELRIEPLEIEDAGWFTARNLPRLPPRISIARVMIDDFVKQQDLDPDGLMTTG